MDVQRIILIPLVKSLTLWSVFVMAPPPGAPQARQHPVTVDSPQPPEDPEAEEEASPVTYSGSEDGRFTIFFEGEAIGHEDFEISGSDRQFKASSSTVLTISRQDPEPSPEYLDDEDFEAPAPPGPRESAPPVTFLIRSSLRFNELFEPETYEVVQDAGPNRMRANVRFLPDRSRVTYRSDDGTDQRKIELRKNVTVLDDNVFVHYLILSRRYDFSRGGIQEFSAFVPQQFLAGGISLSNVGREEVEIGDRTYRLQRLLLDTGELKVNLWLDEDQRLKKLAIPESEVEAVRQ